MDKLLEKFIKEWRLKNNTKDAIYSSYHYDAMIEFAKHYHTQQLILSGVSQQRELLENFADWMDKNVNFDGIRQEEIESYITEKIL